MAESEPLAPAARPSPLPEEAKAGVFAHDGHFWRRLAQMGAARGPWWLVRYSPAVFGLAAAIAVPRARRAAQRNLVRIRGRQPVLREALDVARTFVSYAGCLTEGLTNGSKNERIPDLVVRGAGNMAEAVKEKRGVILVTAHTAGWEVAGPVLSRHHKLEIVMVMEPERSEEARKLSDEARRASGIQVAHVGGDPLASLELLRHLRRGAALAVQIDRMPPGMRGRPVRLFDRDGEIPEGPIRLAMVCHAPIVPTFCARLGHRNYLVEMGVPIRIERRASEDEVSRIAQAMADALTQFVRAHPTQWFHFGE